MATGRRELTWLACDALAAEGRKPSIASVREWTIVNHGRKQGSDTDTQADINAWYTVLLGLKQESHAIAGLPEEIASLARQLWVKATEAAADGLAAQRVTMDAKIADAQLAVTAAEGRGAIAQERVEAVLHELDIAKESIRRLEEALSLSHASQKAADVRHASQLEIRDERLSAMAKDAAKKESEYAARTAELDGLRKHALLQIEQARAEARESKNACEMATATHQIALSGERQATAAVRTELAGALGRLSAVEEALSASQQRVIMLEQQITQLRAQTSGEAASILKKPGMVRASKTMAFRRRKL